MIPLAMEDEDQAQAVHAVVLFPGPVSAGMAAARQLERKLLGNVQPLFHAGTFGNVHMETVSAPYLVSLVAAEEAAELNPGQQC